MCNKKSKLVLIIAFSTVVLITGCSGENNTEKAENAITQQETVRKEGQVQDETNTAQEGGVGYDFPDSIQKTEGNVVFDFSVICPESLREGALYNSTAEIISYDTEKAKKVFGNALDTEALESNEEGKILSVDQSGLNCVSKLGSYYINSVDTDSEEGNLEKYSTDTDLEFMSRQQAYEDIMTTLNELGVSVGECEYTCYALDVETLKQEESVIDSEGNQDAASLKPEWTKEDEGYYFAIRQKVQGIIEYHPYGNVFAKLSEENAPIQVYYSKNGIERIVIEKVFTFTQGEKTINLQPFDTILETVAGRYNDIITDATYQVKEGGLYYKTATFGKEMMPVWVFQIEEHTEDGEVYAINLVVDAQTGKEIPMEGTY